MSRKASNSVRLIPVIEPYGDVVENYGNHLKSLNLTKPLFLNPKLLSIEEWEKAIREHIGDIKIEESCALFGGFILQIGGENYLYPQCCGTLADLNNWIQVEGLEEDEVIYLSEGHPSAGIKTDNHWAHFDCVSDEEDFFPETRPNFKVDKQKLFTAIYEAQNQIDDFVTKLDRVLARNFDVSTLQTLFNGVL